MLTLRHQGSEAVLCPDIGGSIARFRSQVDGQWLDWLRPTGAAALARNEARAMACFPLVPYSNRIRDGRFRFEGRDIRLPRNFGDHPHSIHGHGWQEPWQVTESRPDAALLSYRHHAGAWPFDYEARQDIRLGDDGLTVTLALVNEGDRAMPAGLGLHPFFPRTPGARVVAGVSEMWRVDDEAMPVDRVRPQGANDPNRGVVPECVALDNVYTNWDGHAAITWPEHRVGLELTARELQSGRPLGFLVLFTPAGGDFFCVEPVSHCTDAVNLAAAGARDTGLRVLDPGEAFEVKFTFAPVVGA